MIARFDDLVVNRWSARFRGRQMSVAVGRGGIGEKIGEGDGITPIGKFQIAGLGFRSDRIDFDAPNIHQQPIGLFDIWSDDPKDVDYNHGVTAFCHRYSHEKLRRPDGLYDAFGILDYNWPDAVAGAGSAIFIHAWRKPRHPTEGCIAFAPRDLFTIFARWKPHSRVVIRA